jgi:transposase, IS5 family
MQHLNNQITGHDIRINEGTILDATIVESHARPRKKVIIETEPIGDDDIPGDQIFQPTDLIVEESKDADARWIKKGKKSTYGYKGHVAVDKETGLVQDMIVTSANIYDGHMLAPLVNELNLETGSEVLADKVYCSTENEAFLEKMSLVSKIMKKKKNQAPDSDLIEHNQAISRYRYRIERCFGALKKHFGWSRSIYVGLKKTRDYLLMGGNCL